MSGRDGRIVPDRLLKGGGTFRPQFFVECCSGSPCSAAALSVLSFGAQRHVQEAQVIQPSVEAGIDDAIDPRGDGTLENRGT